MIKQCKKLRLQTFQKKKNVYLKVKIGECEIKSKIKNNRDFNNFKKRYKPRTGIADDEKDDLFEGSYSNLPRWKKTFSSIIGSARG